ncbi:Uncharacterised protein [Vibrio cholerae]|uniref:Uncharacterized protein n=1 Tax=Vibrio cholerae TaxID=666 RepID=A0A656AIR4_VIBCL|nr:Uncharacterised protein [Vibrio cholerae]
MVSTAPFYCFFTAVSFPCYFHSTDVFNNTSYPCANQLVIIYKENTNQTCISTLIYWLCTHRDSGLQRSYPKPTRATFLP